MEAGTVLTKQSGADAAVIVDTARACAAPVQPDPDQPQVFVIPTDAELVLPDLSAWRKTPSRKTGVYKPATVEAFASYVTHHLDAETTTVWVHPTSGEIVAVIDDNAKDGPNWGQHRVETRLAATPEWVYWLDNDNSMLSQSDFAEHIEGGMEEIVEPDAADVLEIAQSFHATTGVTFRQSTRLATGEQQLQYDEEVAASAGRAGELKVPAVILLAISPFIGEEPYKLTARLRFRLGQGKLTLGYKLDRPDAVVRDALESVAEKLAGQFPLTYLGEAPTKG